MKSMISDDKLKAVFKELSDKGKRVRAWMIKDAIKNTWNVEFVEIWLLLVIVQQVCYVTYV